MRGLKIIFIKYNRTDVLIRDSFHTKTVTGVVSTIMRILHTATVILLKITICILIISNSV